MIKNKTEVTVEIENENGEKSEVKIYVVRPTNNSIKGADRYRAKTWNQCIVDGIITKKELTKVLQERKIWDDEKSNAEEKILTKLQQLEKELYLGKSSNQPMKISEGKKIAIEMRKLRIELRDLIAEKIAMEENTAEALSDNAKFDYFVADCTYYENGEKVYKDVDDYNSRSSDEIAYAAAGALAQMMYQFDSKFEESLPENKWLKKFDLVNEDLSLVNKDGELVDINGLKINSFGHYINEKGERVDRDGNLLNEDGTYVIQCQYQTDEEAKTEKVKSKRKSVSTES